MSSSMGACSLGPTPEALAVGAVEALARRGSISSIRSASGSSSRHEARSATVSRAATCGRLTTNHSNYASRHWAFSASLSAHAGESDHPRSIWGSSGCIRGALRDLGRLHVLPARSAGIGRWTLAHIRTSAQSIKLRSCRRGSTSTTLGFEGLVSPAPPPYSEPDS